MQAVQNSLSSPFQVLPVEIKIEIFEFLDVQSLAVIASTCKEFAEISNDDQVWKSVCNNTFNEFVTIFRNEEETWKQTTQRIASGRNDIKNRPLNNRICNFALAAFKQISASYEGAFGSGTHMRTHLENNPCFLLHRCYISSSRKPWFLQD